MGYLAAFACLFAVAVYAVRVAVIAAGDPVRPGERAGAILAWLLGGEQRRRLEAIVAMRLDREREAELAWAARATARGELAARRRRARSVAASNIARHHDALAARRPPAPGFEDILGDLW
jgi:hypothetical protein